MSEKQINDIAKKVINEGRPQSMELDQESMKGYWSNNSFFKLFPKIILFSYNDLLNNNLEEKNDIFKKVNNIYDSLTAEILE